MGFKRSAERMAAIEARLRRGMEERGIGEEAREQIVKSIVSFALYGFPSRTRPASPSSPTPARG